MPRGRVHVVINDGLIIKHLHYDPKAPVRDWTIAFGVKVVLVAKANAPVNNPANAMHRTAKVGGYRRSFKRDRTGSAGHRQFMRIYNDAAHAIFVEEGRSSAYKDQFFSWDTGTMLGGDPQGEWYVRRDPLPGQYEGLFGSTGPRPGRHILRDAFDAVVKSKRLSRADIS